MDEESFRAALDDRGILKPGALAVPRENAFTVFGQRDTPRFPLSDLSRNAERFFAAELGITTKKSYAGTAPEEDAANIILHSEASSGTRLVYARKKDPQDQGAAEDAEIHAGYTGMSLLARRCETVWLVEASGDDDHTSLVIAAIFATVLLGPILSPTADALFGVKTAREKLESMHAAYR